MGMDDLMLSCIRALAENRIQDAKQAAIACCVNDTTKKNAGKTGYYKKLLEGVIYKEKVRDFMRKVRMAQTKYIELLKRNDSNYKPYY